MLIIFYIWIFRGADVDARDNFKLTPLLLASSSSGNSETITKLVNQGANVKLYDTEYRTALHIAVLDDNIACVEVRKFTRYHTNIL